jgi:hypothetical protein
LRPSALFADKLLNRKASPESMTLSSCRVGIDKTAGDADERLPKTLP